jgi:1-acyl-sn-glycerol-3-phosphate acyltransferase
MLPVPRALLTTGRKTSAVAGHLLTLWLGAALVIPRLRARQRQHLAAALARRTLRTLGVSLRVRRERRRHDGPRLLVANHISWLDVYALNAVEEARFVAKSETRTWPLLGTITAAFDALYIVRGSCRDAARVKDVAAAALRHGDTIAVFPEGTTTDGTALRRFYPALFQAAIDAGAAVQPVAIRYPNADGTPNRAAAFVDDMTFLGSLGRILAQPRLTAEVIFGPAIPAAGRTRGELAALAREHIAEQLAPMGCAIEPQVLHRRGARTRSTVCMRARAIP